MSDLSDRIDAFAEKFSTVEGLSDMIAVNLHTQAHNDSNFAAKFDILEQQNILNEVGAGNDVLGVSFQLGGENPGISLTTSNPQALTMAMSEQGFQLTDFMLTRIGEFAVDNANGQIAKMEKQIDRGRMPPDSAINSVTGQINGATAIKAQLANAGIELTEINQFSAEAQQYFPNVNAAAPQVAPAAAAPAQQPQTVEPPPAPEGDPVSVIDHHRSGLSIYQYPNGQIEIFSDGSLEDGDPLFSGGIIYNPETATLHHSNEIEVRSLGEAVQNGAETLSAAEQSREYTGANYPVEFQQGYSLIESLIPADVPNSADGETGVSEVASESGFLTATIYDTGNINDGAIRIVARHPETGGITELTADGNTVSIIKYDAQGNNPQSSGNIELNQSLSPEDIRYDAPAASPQTFGMD